MPVAKKILIPEYAIAQRLITQDEYDSLRNTYLAQSQACFSVIIPLGFLFAVAWVRLPSIPGAAYWAIGGLALLALTAGFDRLHRYHAALQALIIGRFDARQEATKAQKPAAPAPSDANAGTNLQQAVKRIDREVKTLEHLIAEQKTIDRLEKQVSDLVAHLAPMETPATPAASQPEAPPAETPAQGEEPS